MCVLELYFGYPRKKRELKTRTLLLGITILLLGAGVFFLANASVIPHETLTSSRGFSVHDSGIGNWFELMGGGTMTPNDQAVRTVGTSGTGTVIVMKASYDDFSCFMDQTDPACSYGLGAGSTFNNVTMLSSYIQTHQVEIPYSKVVSGENVTLDYHVTVPTNVTIVFVPMSTVRMTSYFSVKSSNSTLIYPVLGWTQNPNTGWSPMNISIILLTGGAVAFLTVALIAFKPNLRRGMEEHAAPATRKCPSCGGQNLFFAEECAHCHDRLIVEKPTLVVN